MPLFINRYKCPNDGAKWTDTWDCACNDRCPVCNAEIEPYDSDEIPIDDEE
jgi:transcription initiation factor IIE alpha subunit